MYFSTRFIIIVFIVIVYDIIIRRLSLHLLQMLFSLLFSLLFLLLSPFWYLLSGYVIPWLLLMFLYFIFYYILILMNIAVGIIITPFTFIIIIHLYSTHSLPLYRIIQLRLILLHNRILYIHILLMVNIVTLYAAYHWRVTIIIAITILLCDHKRWQLVIWYIHTL